eukprot:scaffold123068_cov13-Tisochrysis_lutea.AAC.1
MFVHAALPANSKIQVNISCCLAAALALEVGRVCLHCNCKSKYEVTARGQRIRQPEEHSTSHLKYKVTGQFYVCLQRVALQLTPRAAEAQSESALAHVGSIIERKERGPQMGNCVSAPPEVKYDAKEHSCT